MTNRLMNNMMAKTGRYLEHLEEIKDGYFEKIVNSYREKTKSDNDYVMKKSTNKLIRKYDIKILKKCYVVVNALKKRMFPVLLLILIIILNVDHE